MSKKQTETERVQNQTNAEWLAEYDQATALSPAEITEYYAQISRDKGPEIVKVPNNDT